MIIKNRQDMLPPQPVQHVKISQHKIKVEESSVISISDEEPDDKTREIPCTLKTEKDSVIALTEEDINQDETLKDETVRQYWGILQKQNLYPLPSSKLETIFF